MDTLTTIKTFECGRSGVVSGRVIEHVVAHYSASFICRMHSHVRDDRTTRRRKRRRSRRRRRRRRRKRYMRGYTWK